MANVHTDDLCTHTALGSIKGTGLSWLRSSTIFHNAMHVRPITFQTGKTTNAKATVSPFYATAGDLERDLVLA